MHDLLGVAVVDAREDLLHEHGGVLFGEFAALEDFVEQLAALADPVEQTGRPLAVPERLESSLTQSPGSSASRPQRTRTS